ncbi:MAG: hypothetical protein LAO21_17620 [Acidobacteriia bacterium]|nr:hypothetical protein [Terriglobia bacterium]
MRILVIDAGGTHVKMLEGGSARLLKKLSSGTCPGTNSNVFQGGYRLWTKPYRGSTHKQFVH